MLLSALRAPIPESLILALVVLPVHNVYDIIVVEDAVSLDELLFGASEKLRCDIQDLGELVVGVGDSRGDADLAWVRGVARQSHEYSPNPPLAWL